MVFSSLVFVFIFLPIVLITYYLVPQKWKNLVLLLGSLFFYWYGEHWFFCVFLVSIVVNYIISFLIFKGNSRLWLLVGIFIDFILLWVFKYLTFTLSVFKDLTDVEIFIPRIALPIGISFFTFQQVSYLVDVYKEKSLFEKSFINYATYVSMFPQLIAGPIVRYSNITNELRNDKRVSANNIGDGIQRFIIGFLKKVIIANNVAYISDSLWNRIQTTEVTACSAWIGTIAFSIQIFYDFSGYSDMAIGIGQILGFSFPENFKQPYSATSITDFWRRWHISLSSWFRDYVYIPLGGNRVPVRKHIANILLVWLFTGLWHGAGYNFVLWGVNYGVLLIVEKYVIKPDNRNRVIKALYRVITLLLININWALFKSTSEFGGIHAFLKIIRSMCCFRNEIVGEIDVYTINMYGKYLLLSLVCLMPIGKLFRKIVKKPFPIEVTFLVLFIAFYVAISYIIMGSNNPFIYFNF